MIDITSLDVECKADGSAKVDCWVKCHTLDDVTEIVEWLHLAGDLMLGWKTICDKRAGQPPADSKVTSINKGKEK